VDEVVLTITKGDRFANPKRRRHGHLCSGEWRADETMRVTNPKLWEVSVKVRCNRCGAWSTMSAEAFDRS
jgi:hypothetical protein